QSGGFIVANAGSGARGTGPAENLATFSGVFLSDAAVGADVLLGAGDGKAGVVARYQGPDDFYAALLERQGGSAFARIYHYQGGMPELLAASAPLATLAAVPRLEFEVLGNSLAVYVDGQLQAWATDDTLSGPGRVGILAVGATALDGFSVRLVG